MLNGTLTIMTGCEKETFEAVKPLLEAMGKNIIYTGDVGTASNVKLLNQMLNAGNTAVGSCMFCVNEVSLYIRNEACGCELRWGELNKFRPRYIYFRVTKRCYRDDCCEKSAQDWCERFEIEIEE